MPQAAVDTARDYYNSDDADRFYRLVWGGEDIHVGIYLSDDEPILAASHRTVERMARKLPSIESSYRILDLGSGYCGAARYLASHYGVFVTALNLSEVENQRARHLNARAGLTERIEVHDGSFESLSFDTETFDVLWSQDAILHSEQREKVITEAFRVLKPGGHFVFTDPMQADDCPEGVLDPILNRIHLSSLGSQRFYRKAADAAGFHLVHFENLSTELPHHYRRVLEETNARAEELRGQVSSDYLQRMRTGLQHWIEGGRSGYLTWGIFLFRKP